jgi:hypothetical protein
MRKFLGFAVLMAGLAFGTLAYFPEAIDREGRLAELTRIAAAPAGGLDPQSSEPAEFRSFAPRQPMGITPPSQIAKAPGITTVAKASPAPTETTALAPASARTPSETKDPPWQTTVTPDPAAVPAGARLTSSKPGDGQTRYELVLSIQRELKRSGCYGGSLTGSWSTNTKNAMSAFMERVNATLPIDEPDYILLTLLKGHSHAGCGIECPRGQSMAEGRCVPSSVIAQTPRVPVRLEEPKPVAAAAVPATPSLPAASASGFTTTVSVAAADTSAPRSSAAAPVPAKPEPLPGRMAIGGPQSGAESGAKNWNVRVVPTPATPAVPAEPPSGPWSAGAPAVAAAPPAARATPTPTPTVVRSPAIAPPAPPKRIAALEQDEPQEPYSAGTEVAPATPSPANGQTPSAGAPGAKSGRGVSVPRPAWRPSYAPPPVYIAPSPRPPRVYSAPRPRPSVSKRPERQIVRRGSTGTRSVKAIFSNPLGL